MTLTRRQQQLLWLSVGLSAAGYLVFALWSGWQDVLHAVQRIGFWPIAVSLLLSLGNYLLRGERWALYLRQDRHPLPRLLNQRIYFAGFALTTTPGKAGELIRSLFLRPYGVQYHHSAAMFFSERLADLVAIVVLTALGLTHLHQGEVYFLLLVAALLAGLLLLRTRWPEQLLRRLAGGTRKGLQWLAEVAASSRPFWRGRLLWQAQGLSLVAWLAEGFGAWLVLRSLMPDIPLSLALFIYGFAMLVGALSFLPGGLGGTEATMTGLLVLQGMALPEAVAATVVIRLATLWFAVVLGLFAVLSLPTQPGVPQPVREETS
ncbi:lysylphosphatidylglycerol synthase transmembrane domain-containing protein [Amnimonas aquatica]|uniref:TIGR00374 family protein n=1 Tax=Amnimonas aquatica TaxID=2094561 RepID=A0A2P6AVG1_9GAMM|nr:lysylphosphatidylglycerol synthase transmembrane domain-containing protein [Amnimonas aquatica]PQA52221.1 TIGR00374 family protein [Amnimonas aquatica]